MFYLRVLSTVSVRHEQRAVSVTYEHMFELCSKTAPCSRSSVDLPLRWLFLSPRPPQEHTPSGSGYKHVILSFRPVCGSSIRRSPPGENAFALAQLHITIIVIININ